MKTKLFVILVFFVSLVGCNTNKTSSGIESFLSEKAVKVSVGGANGLNISLITDTISNLNSNVCYVLNANCSFCFATFFSFVKELENYGLNYQIATILDQGTACNLEFYQEQVALKKKVFIIENINNEYINGNIEEKGFNSLFFVSNNGVVECYKYVGYE